MAKYIHRKYNVTSTKYKFVEQDSNSGFLLSSKCSETTDDKIKKMTLDDYDDYVYDLTTDNHHFA